MQHEHHRHNYCWALPRHKGELYFHFDEDNRGGSATFKTNQFKGKHCNRTVSRSTKSTSKHLLNCSKAPHSLGLPNAAFGEAAPLQEEESTLGSISTAQRSSSANTGPFMHYVRDSFSSDVLKEIDITFGLAIHKTATPFTSFKNPALSAFLGTLRPCWKPVAPSGIGGVLLDSAHEGAMLKVMLLIKGSKSGTMGIHGATNSISISLSNIVLHTLCPLFIEYSRSDLKQETTPNVVEKVNSVVERLKRRQDSISFRALSWTASTEWETSAAVLLNRSWSDGRTGVLSVALIIFARTLLSCCSGI